MIKEATHYGVNVSDMNAALAFHRDLRRFSTGDVQSDIVGVDDVTGKIAFLDAGPITTELIMTDTEGSKNAEETNTA
jgi:hypothetical protein